MPHKYFEEQFEDEEVLMVFRKHPVVMRKGLIVSSIIILLGTVPSLVKPDLSYFFGGLAVGFILSIIAFIPFWINWYYSIYIVTDQRLIQIAQKGLFHRSQVPLSLSQIQMVSYEISGFQETLLGFGTIVIQTFVGSLTIHEVHHPAKIQKEMLKILRDQGITANSSPMEQTQMQATEAEAEAEA